MPVSDFRIRLGFSSHPKVLNLLRKHGSMAGWALIRLWEWVALHYPGGEIKADAATIEYACGWAEDRDISSPPGSFCEALVKLGFLHEIEGGFLVHDWREHQPWVAGHPLRQEAARKAGKASSKKRADATKVNGSSTASEKRSNGIKRAVENGSNPSPLPSSPILSEEDPNMVTATVTDETMRRSEWDGKAFDGFWKLYPRKVAKAAARKAWGQLLPNGGHSREDARTRYKSIVRLLDLRLEDWQDRPEDKIPHASTWLRQEDFDETSD